MIQLDVISDPICPWCYIGKANLDDALAAGGTNPFDIFWRPFQLNPEMPAEGMDRQAYLDWKFGGRAAAQEIYARIEDAAKEAGLDVDFSRIGRAPNTFDAHRLIRWSRSTGNQGAVVHQLFLRYFQNGEDISDRDLLLDVGEGAGMERDVIARLYDGDADRELLETEETTAREMGVTGVPTFIVGGRHVVTGAQPAALWSKVIGEVTEAAN